MLVCEIRSLGVSELFGHETGWSHCPPVFTLPEVHALPDGHALLTTQTGSGLVLSIGFREGFLLMIALIDSKHLSWRLRQANGSPSEHIPDKGVVNADTFGRNRDMYSMSPRKC